MAIEFLLAAMQACDDGIHLLQSLDHQGVLQAFLQDGLQAALGVAHIVRNVAHPPHIQFAGNQKDGQDHNHDTGQRAIHPEQQEKCTRELQDRSQQSRDILGGKRNYIVDILLQAVDQITGMEAA